MARLHCFVLVVHNTTEARNFPDISDGISHHSVGKEGSIQLWSEVEESSKMSKLGCRDRDDGISSFSEFFHSFPPCSTRERGNIAKKRKRVEKLVSSLRVEENKQGAEAMGNPPSLPSVDKSIAVGFT